MAAEEAVTFAKAGCFDTKRSSGAVRAGAGAGVWTYCTAGLGGGTFYLLSLLCLRLIPALGLCKHPSLLRRSLALLCPSSMPCLLLAAFRLRCCPYRAGCLLPAFYALLSACLMLCSPSTIPKKAFTLPFLISLNFVLLTSFSTTCPAILFSSSGREAASLGFAVITAFNLLLASYAALCSFSFAPCAYHKLLFLHFRCDLFVVYQAFWFWMVGGRCGGHTFLRWAGRIRRWCWTRGEEKDAFRHYSSCRA